MISRLAGKPKLVGTARGAVPVAERKRQATEPGAFALPSHLRLGEAVRRKTGKRRTADGAAHRPYQQKKNPAPARPERGW